MDQSNAQLNARVGLSIKALNHLLDATYPVQLSDLFVRGEAEGKWQLQEIQDTKWQLLLLLVLSKKDAVGRVHKPGDDKYPRFSVKNRFFLSSLLTDAKNGGKRLGDIIEGHDTTSAQPPALPRKSEDTSPFTFQDEKRQTESRSDSSENESPQELIQAEEHSWTEGTAGWGEKILEYIDGKESVTTTDILVDAIGFPPESVNNAMKKVVGGVLRENGWSPRTYYDGPKKTRVWQPNGSESLRPLAAPAALPSVEETGGGVVTILETLKQAISYSVELQHGMATNLVYIRKSSDKLSQAVQDLDRRIQVLEAKADGQKDTSMELVPSVNSQQPDVSSLMEAALGKAHEQKIAQAATLLGHIQSEVSMLRNSVQALLEEEGDE